MTVAAVILAAGFSRRLGQPKQDVVLGTETLLERAVRVAAAARLSPVIAVVHDSRWLLHPHLPGATVLLNEHAAEGMSTSVVAGVRQVQQTDAEGVILLTCDQPLLGSEHLRSLAATPGRITASAYAGRVGVPAFFPASSFPALLRLKGDKGARDLLEDAVAVVNEDLALDIDTEDDLRRAKQEFAPGRGRSATSSTR